MAVAYSSEIDPLRQNTPVPSRFAVRSRSFRMVGYQAAQASPPACQAARVA